MSRITVILVCLGVAGPGWAGWEGVGEVQHDDQVPRHCWSVLYPSSSTNICQVFLLLVDHDLVSLNCAPQTPSPRNMNLNVNLIYGPCGKIQVAKLPFSTNNFPA